MAICHFSSVDSGGGLLGHRIKLRLWQIIHLLPSVAAALCIPISKAWESVLFCCLKKIWFILIDMQMWQYHLTIILFYIFLMTNNVKYHLVSFSIIPTSSFVTHLFKSPAYFLIQWAVCSYCWLYTFILQILFQAQASKCLFPVCGSSSHFLIYSSKWNKETIFGKCQFLIRLLSVQPFGAICPPCCSAAVPSPGMQNRLTL